MARRKVLVLENEMRDDKEEGREVRGARSSVSTSRCCLATRQLHEAEEPAVQPMTSSDAEGVPYLAAKVVCATETERDWSTSICCIAPMDYLFPWI